MRRLHSRLAPEIGQWEFPSAAEIDRRAKAGGDLAAVWARVDRKLYDPPDVSDLFRPPEVSTFRWMATYDSAGYVSMVASQSSYALLGPTVAGSYSTASPS